MDGNELTDPFAPIPAPAAPVTPNVPALPEDRIFHIVDEKGWVIKCKMESGVPVRLAKVGKLKERVRKALYDAAFENFKEKTEEELSKMTNIEAAAYRMARAAALGSGEAIKELFDRIIGKPTQSSISVRANMNVDQALTEEDEKDEDDAIETEASEAE